MDLKVIEVIADAGHLDTLRSLAESHEAVDIWHGQYGEDGRIALRMLVRAEHRQALLDAMQSVLGASETARVLILPVEAALPRIEEDEDEAERQRRSIGTTREELYSSISTGARLDSNFLLLTFLSTVVASIGLIEDNVAVVIGAMVIAPLLGPNLALSLAASLGDTELFRDALKTNIAGLGLTLLLSLGIGLVFDLDYNSVELMARTVVGMDSVALALASGAAAVLSLTTGLPTALVGVMVAVALLPPAAVVGMMIGAGQLKFALSAVLLLAVNIVCVNLAAMIVFFFKGVKPRTWLEKRKAGQSMKLSIAFWAAWLVILIALIYAVKPRLLP